MEHTERQYFRGDVYYIDRGTATGSEQYGGRPAIIVSNEKNNTFSDTLEVVYLTTQPKKYLPTHVQIHSLKRESIAICEQITTVSKERVGSYGGAITAQEMLNVENAMLISLDLSLAPSPAKEDEPGPLPSGDDRLEELDAIRKYAALEAKYDLLREMYDALLAGAMRREGRP